MKKSRHITICDLETTGSNAINTEIVEVYLAKYQGAKKIDELHLYVKPRTWDSEAEKSVAFHGISKEKAMDGIPWRESMKMIWDFLPDEPEHFLCHANRRMFGRQGCFDWQVLASHFLDIGFEHYLHFGRIYRPQMIISTHSLAKEILGAQKNDLKSIADALGIKLVNHHTAKNDAEATWKIFQKLIRSISDLDAFLEEDYYRLRDHNTHTSSEKGLETIFSDAPIFDSEFYGGNYDY